MLDSINMLDVKDESSSLCNEELGYRKLAREELAKNYSYGLDLLEAKLKSFVA